MNGSYLLGPLQHKVMSIVRENTVSHRFARRKDQEYHVFSVHLTDVSGVKEWVSIEQPVRVLMDQDTYAELRNQKIEWVFDEEKTLSACRIKGSQ